MVETHAIQVPYLLFLGDASDPLAAKTAEGIAHWHPEACVGQLRLPGCRADCRLPDLSLNEARERGARTLVLGVANRGGRISDDWIQLLNKALDLGYDIASGLHNRLNAIPSLYAAAAQNDCRLIDVRYPTADYPIATGERRAGKRLLTVGTDCSVGKMYTSLALARSMAARGLDHSFRATGQTGIFIAGGGVPVDAVVADFIAGSVEALTPPNRSDHWDLIEGQGSLFHPSYAGVSLGLLHGSQPDALVVCHEPERPHMRGLPGRPVPDIAETIALNERMAQMVNPDAKVIGMALNTSKFSTASADALTSQLSEQLGMPCVDPLVHGVEPIVDALP
jgi:uncharacterized NAD-dependent epimerase/dehydratase family protein